MKLIGVRKQTPSNDRGQEPACLAQHLLMHANALALEEAARLMATSSGTELVPANA